VSTHDQCCSNCGSTDCSASTITTSYAHDIKPGDFITFEMRDVRWWRRLLFWLLRRGEPRVTIGRRVSQASKTTLTL
jgi:hypothetical protein